MTTMDRIAAAMGCAPADDDDLVEAVRLLVAERDAARAELESTERARYAAEDERDTVLELVADDAVDAARARDDRDAARLHAVATLRVALADAEARLAALAAAVREERAVTAACEHAWAQHITADDLAGAAEVLALDARLDAARAALDAALGAT